MHVSRDDEILAIRHTMIKRKNGGIWVNVPIKPDPNIVVEKAKKLIMQFASEQEP